MLNGREGFFVCTGVEVWVGVSKGDAKLPKDDGDCLHDGHEGAEDGPVPSLVKFWSVSTYKELKPTEEWHLVSDCSLSQFIILFSLVLYPQWLRLNSWPSSLCRFILASFPLTLISPFDLCNFLCFQRRIVEWFPGLVLEHCSRGNKDISFGRSSSSLSSSSSVMSSKP